MAYFLMSDFDLGFYTFPLGFPRSSVGKESAGSAGDLSSIPGLERSPGEGNGNPLQCSCLENPMDGGVQGFPGVGQDLATKLPLLLSHYLSTFVSVLYQTSCSLASVRTSASSLFFFKSILIILDPLRSFIMHTKNTSQTKNR